MGSQTMNVSQTFISLLKLNNVTKVKQLLLTGAVRLNKYIKFQEGVWFKRCTPLCLAIQLGSEDMSTYLIQAGANVNKSMYCDGIGHHEKMSPLYIACRQGLLQIVQLLITAGADVNQTLQGPKLREEEGASIDYGDNDDTCLHWAVLYRKEELAMKLVECGANVRSVNARQQTALHLACDTGNLPLIRYLTLAGGLSCTPDTHGSTPLSTVIMSRCDADDVKRTVRLMLAGGYRLTFEPVWLSGCVLFLNRRILTIISDDGNIGSGEQEDGGLANHSFWNRRQQALIMKYSVSFMSQILRWHDQPKSLKWLCRLTVRNCIGGIRLLAKLQLLELPIVLLSYLKLDVLD